MEMNIIATIELDGKIGRGAIFAVLEECAYYESEGIDTAYVIYVRLPSGDIENPGIAPQRSMNEVKAAVLESWGAPVWDLKSEVLL